MAQGFISSFVSTTTTTLAAPPPSSLKVLI
jgi:hypothetical protein